MLLNSCQSNRLIFEKVSLDHFNQWLKFFESDITSLHWKEEKESPQQECKKWYARQFLRYEKNQGGMNALIEKASGKLIGHAGLVLQTVDEKQEWEIAYSLLPEFWNNGFAIEAARKCKEVGFESQVAASLISIISLTNIPSQKVATKNGMHIDKQTVYRGNDVYIFRVTNT